MTGGSCEVLEISADVCSAEVLGSVVWAAEGNEVVSGSVVTELEAALSVLTEFDEVSSGAIVEPNSDVLASGVLSAGADTVGVSTAGVVRAGVSTTTDVGSGSSVPKLVEDSTSDDRVGTVLLADFAVDTTSCAVVLGGLDTTGLEVVGTVDSVALEVNGVLEVVDITELVALVVEGVIVVFGFGFFLVRFVDMEVEAVDDVVGVEVVSVGVGIGIGMGCVDGVV